MISISKKQYWAAGAVAVTLIAIVSGVGYFFSHYALRFENPVLVSIRKAVWVENRIVSTTTIVNVSDAPSQQDVSLFTPDMQFGCNLFGQAECKTFIGIMLAESGGRHDAYHVNTNGSVDLGCMELDSVHLSQIDTSNLNLLNCQDNIRAAYEIFKASGWNAWSTYKNQNYKAAYQNYFSIK